MTTDEAVAIADRHDPGERDDIIDALYALAAEDVIEALVVLAAEVRRCHAREDTERGMP